MMTHMQLLESHKWYPIILRVCVKITNSDAKAMKHLFIVYNFTWIESDDSAEKCQMYLRFYIYKYVIVGNTEFPSYFGVANVCRAA